MKGGVEGSSFWLFTSQAQVCSAMANMPRALSATGCDLDVVYRRGGATRRMFWPP